MTSPSSYHLHNLTCQMGFESLHNIEIACYEQPIENSSLDCHQLVALAQFAQLTCCFDKAV